MSIFFSLLLALTPEGQSRKITRLACSAAMILQLFSVFGGFSADSFALDLAAYREAGARMGQEAEEASQRISRPVIEQEYLTYIRDKAAEKGLEIRSLSLSLRWDREGLWVPESLTGYYRGEGKSLESLRGLLAAELGIAREEQQWYGEGDP